MDATAAFRKYSRSLPTQREVRVFLQEDLSCAMIAVFGFKFRKQDLSVCMERHGQLVTIQSPQSMSMSTSNGYGLNFSNGYGLGYTCDYNNIHDIHNSIHNTNNNGSRQVRVLLESEFLELVRERKKLLEHVSDPRYKQFASLDTDGLGHVSREMMRKYLHRDIADRIFRAITRGESHKEYFTFHDFKRYLEL